MTLTLVGGGDIDRHAEERPELRVVEMWSQLFGPPQVCAWFGLDGAEEQRPEGSGRELRVVNSSKYGPNLPMEK